MEQSTCKESAIGNHQTYSIKVINFEYITSNKKIEKTTGFESGTELLYIQRLHYFDGKHLIKSMALIFLDIENEIFYTKIRRMKFALYNSFLLVFVIMFAAFTTPSSFCLRE